MAAKERGLEPGRDHLRLDESQERDLDEEAALYIDLELGVSSVKEALDGAKDIIAEWVNEMPGEI